MPLVVLDVATRACSAAAVVVVNSAASVVGAQPSTGRLAKSQRAVAADPADGPQGPTVSITGDVPLCATCTGTTRSRHCVGDCGTAKSNGADPMNQLHAGSRFRRPARRN